MRIDMNNHQRIALQDAKSTYLSRYYDIVELRSEMLHRLGPWEEFKCINILINKKRGNIYNVMKFDSGILQFNYAYYNKNMAIYINKAVKCKYELIDIIKTISGTYLYKLKQIK